MDKFCYSCSAPLSVPEYQGSHENYCKYCMTDQGDLVSKEQIHEAITQWFLSWQPDVTKEVAAKRAALYLSAMPAWAES